MRVKDLIDVLPASSFTYQGDLDLELRGLVLDPPKRKTRGRFLYPRDASWPQVPEEAPLPSRQKTERTIQRALNYGISGIICSSELRGAPYLEGKNVFFSDDTFALTCRIVAAIRESLDTQRITAITGSAGKTTTKAMLLHALRAIGEESIATNPGNLNLQRMALRRLSLSPQFSHSVLEISSSALMAFRKSGFTISPDVGIITSIAEAHLEHMESLENVARIKSDVFQAPPAGGTAIINADAPHADILIQRAVSEGCQLVTYGESENATIRLASWDPQTHDAVAMVGQQPIEYRVGPAGKHSVLNSLAVIAALRAHRLKNWRQGVEALASFEALEGRGQTVEIRLDTGAQITLIDEAYNANTASVRSSLASLSAMASDGSKRRVAVLGDILELGPQADQIHRDLADVVLAANLDHVYLFGTHMTALFDELKGRTDLVHHWPDLASLKTDLPSQLRERDIVLMKASGSTGLKDWVAELVAASSSPS